MVNTWLNSRSIGGRPAASLKKPAERFPLSSTVSPTWYEDFFTELPNEFWRQAIPPDATEAEIDFAERQLGLTPGARVLDLPCGSGRHTLIFARKGYLVTGYDISPEAIAFAKASAADQGLDVDLGIAEMREIPRETAFDAVVCLGNSFGYLDLPGTEELAATLASAVRAGGGLMLDINTAAESVLPGYNSEPRTMVAGDITMTGTTEYDVTNSRLLSHYRFSRGTEAVDVTAVHHLYTVAHIRHLLTEAGFINLELFSDPDGSPHTLGDGRLLLTAQRA